MREDRKKYLRSNGPEIITPNDGADQDLEQMRMFRWLQSMTEWMTEYGQVTQQDNRAVEEPSRLSRE